MQTAENHFGKSIKEAGLVLTIGLSAGLLLTGSLLGAPVVALILGLFAAAMYYRQPTFFLYLITTYLFFGDFVFTKLGLPSVGLIDEALAFGLLILFVARRWLKHEPATTPWVSKYALGLLGIIVVSAFANGVDPLLTFNFISTLFKPVILFYIILESNFKEDQLYTLLKFVIGIGAVQGLIVLQQYGLGMFSGSDTMDVATGTLGFGLQHHVGYLLLLLAIILGSVFINERKNWQFVLATVFAGGFFITNTMHALMVLPVVLILLLFSLSKKMAMQARLAMFGIVPLIVVLTMSLVGEEKVASTFDTETMQQTGKVISYQTLFSELPAELGFFGSIIGAGPGMYASEIAVKNRSPLFLKFVYPIIEHMPDDAKSSTLNFPWTSIIAMLAELGPFGLLLYSLFILRLYREIRGIYWEDSTPPLWKGLAIGIMGALIFMWLMAFIMTAFEDMFLTYPIFMLSGIVIARAKLMERLN